MRPHDWRLPGGRSQTTIGGTTLIDTATAINGAVSPTSFLTYVSGGDRVTGSDNGASYTVLSPGLTPSAAMATADHQWAQLDAPIIVRSATALNAVIAVPAIDHGRTAANTDEYWEPLELLLYGCKTSTFSLTSCQVGRVTEVWTKGRRRRRCLEERRRLDDAVEFRRGVQLLCRDLG